MTNNFNKIIWKDIQNEVNTNYLEVNIFTSLVF